MGGAAGTVAAARSRSRPRRSDRGSRRQRLIDLVRPRHGELAANAVLRPLGEQLVERLALHPGATACELVCDGGVLSSMLARTLGPEGVLHIADSDPSLAREAAAHNVSRCVTHALRLHDGRIPLADGSCDVVTSLIALPCAGAPGLLVDALRVLRPRGAMVVCVWDWQAPPPHESMLRNALRRAGVPPLPFECLLEPVTLPAGAEVHALRDAARLQTFNHLWADMLPRLAGLPDEVLSVVRVSYEDSMSTFAASDGSITVPVTAVLMRRAR